jgi:large subunit ribosomal protein L4
MASLKLVDIQGADQGTVEGNDKIFGAELNETLVHQVVVALQANARQGTHKTKTRREVRGGGSKPFRQKGTGRARQGSIREPQMRGGGTVHGPVPRSYRKDVNTRVRRQALCCLLSSRAQEENLSVVTGLQIDGPKTKPFAQMLEAVSPCDSFVSGQSKKTLLVTADADENVVLSARNIPRVFVRTATDVNVLDVMLAGRVVVQQEALAKLEERLS